VNAESEKSDASGGGGMEAFLKILSVVSANSNQDGRFVEYDFDDIKEDLPGDLLAILEKNDNLAAKKCGE
jgi:hypothetical protein